MAALSDYFADSGLASIGDKISNINSLASAADAVSSIEDFLNPAPVSLGSFKFRDWEVPETLTRSARRNTVMHKHPGGLRTIDDLGADPDPITWQGIFGINQNQNPRMLSLHKIAGTVCKLSWKQERWDVYVDSVTFEYCSIGIKYTVNCVIIDTEMAKPALGLLGSITKSIGDAIGVDLPAAISNVQTIVKGVAPVLGGVGNLMGGGSAALGINSVVTRALGVVNGAAGVANGNIGAITQAMHSVSGAPGGISTISNLVSNFGQAVPLARIGNNLQVASNNLSNKGAS